MIKIPKSHLVIVLFFFSGKYIQGRKSNNIRGEKIYSLKKLFYIIIIFIHNFLINI